MASYRCSVKPNLSRNKGASVARAAAYIGRGKVHDERTGDGFDFSKHKDKALFVGVYAPKDAPAWIRNPEAFANELERAEKRKDAQLARPIELSLAHELTLEQNRWMMQDFIKENFTRPGYATLAAIHEPPEGGDPRNIHAHLLVSLRTIDENGFAKTKAQEQENYLNRSAYTEGLRQSWEKHLKRHLKRHGFEKEAAEVSCKSLEAQGIEREPQKHLGPAASAMERKGKKTERGAINGAILEQNRQLERLERASKEHAAAIAETQAQLEQETKAKQAELARRAREQAYRERDAKAQEAIRTAWTTAPRDAIAFMVSLNERGLYVARHEKGYYVAVEPSGYAHRLPDKDMQAGIEALQRENSGLVIPALEEQRDAQRQQREEERGRKEQQQSAHVAATLYNHASMPKMQRDALLHIRDRRKQREAQQRRERQEQERRQKQEQERQEAEKRRQQEAERQRRQQQERERREREQQEAERKRQEAERRRQQQQREREERERARAREPASDQRQQAREDKRARTEQSEYQQRRAQREKLREQLGLRRQNGRGRDDDGGRERER